MVHAPKTLICFPFLASFTYLLVLLTCLLMDDITFEYFRANYEFGYSKT